MSQNSKEYVPVKPPSSPVKICLYRESPWTLMGETGNDFAESRENVDFRTSFGFGRFSVGIRGSSLS